MALHRLIEEKLTHSAIGAFFEVYNTLGFGFLEPVYMLALGLELRERGHHVAREVWVPVMYKGQALCKQRVDMIVDQKLVLEVKATADLPKTGGRQLKNYLRATSLPVGLLFHFGAEPRFYRFVGPATRASTTGEFHGSITDDTDQTDGA